MTYEELLAKALGHAEAAEKWIAIAGDAAVQNSPATQAYLMISNVEAMLAEAYARMASAQVVNGTSVAQMAGVLASAPTSGRSS